MSLSSLSSVCLSLQEENYFVGLCCYIFITASGLFSKYHEVENCEHFGSVLQCQNTDM
jgi:hypothetical protein